ncbi:choline ABC transporter substrate-binding protein [Burkholderia multivorans]|uniref:choline ABC transporter substrate-binding protein n=1 Tax=Burkholderia multivorans TaxID=87883 RepID=UPI000841A043|nr:choline ABC transporter substrate-binding protein [Burkholderia multivorans]AOJ96205.1 glycine/betaine ABC transporter substrate-binding protein [Burkholderia multivorans]MCO1340859.1 choline ABC transporter substrate-binding protein [Burkholderia multivorans]MCO1439967.1 choline ABC transporter substrate-binding protein [Burkholderia multivorans]MDR8751398.1 Glycine betaine-binding protein OpuAC [Burkholderia multivorans]MDR8807436.1 Glycine betaine-binding protein OpuAC [Burkholderia mult
MRLKHIHLCGILALACALPAVASARDDASCRDVRLSNIGWTDITVTTAVASLLFESLGYRPATTISSVPISFAGLKSKQIDVSLGYWWPIQEKQITPFLDSNAFVKLEPPNLSGAKETLATVDYAFQGGLQSFDDIAKHRSELDGKIYGIEPGSSANATIQKMIDTNQYGLRGFKLVESSEAGMLVTVQRAVREKKWIVFIGWAPHPMNIQVPIKYLAGGDASFGPNYGEARVYTLTSTGYAQRCPNAGRLVSNLRFTTEMENRMMLAVMNGTKPADAAKDYVRQHPDTLEGWLRGVTGFDGGNGLAAAKAALGL